MGTGGVERDGSFEWEGPEVRTGGVERGGSFEREGPEVGNRRGGKGWEF